MTARLTTLRALFLHNDWARDKLFEAALPLADEALDDPVEMGPGSLRATLEHLCRAERWWLDRWQGSADPLTEPEPGIALRELQARFRGIERERNEFLDTRDEAEQIACTTDTGDSLRLALSDMMLHVCNHGFHHRAQALNMLRQVGIKGPDIDYLHMTMDRSVKFRPSYQLDVITAYYQYNDWARERILKAVAPLEDDELDRSFKISYTGTPRKTLLHIRDAEQWWLLNWSGEPAESFAELPATTPIGGLRKESDEIARHRRELFETLGDGDLTRTVTANPRPGVELTFTLGDTMVQLCGHGTHHRAQVLNMLRRLNVEGPGLDLADWAKMGTGTY